MSKLHVSQIYFAQTRPPNPCVMSMIKLCYKQEYEKFSQKQKVVLGIQIGTKEKLKYEHGKDQTEMELCKCLKGI